MPNVSSTVNHKNSLRNAKARPVSAFAGNASPRSQASFPKGRAAAQPTVTNVAALRREESHLETLLREVRKQIQVIFRQAAGDKEEGSISDARVERDRPVLDTAEAMLARGDLLEPVLFQEEMGWKSRQAVWKAADSRRVFFIEHRSERYFPAFYADARYQRSHLEAISKILGDLPGGSKLQFFLTRKKSLDGRTPLEALAHGDLAKVKKVASAFAEVPLRN